MNTISRCLTSSHLPKPRPLHLGLRLRLPTGLATLACSITSLAIAAIGSPIQVPYTSFDGAALELFAFKGNHVAFLVSQSEPDPILSDKLVPTFDRVYEYYRSVAGREPTLYYNLDGLTTIAAVPSTCGAGCGFLGFTGIELLESYYDILYQGVKFRDEYDQALFYEFGRNFWLYDNKLAYKAPEDAGSVVTGFAVFMRFMAMDAVGVIPAPFNGTDFSVFRSEVVSLLDKYQADAAFTWATTLALGQAPPNPLGLGGADMFAAFLFELTKRYGQGFVSELWKEVDKRPDAQTTQDAVDNFVLASSSAAGENLIDLFAKDWRWPLSSAARNEAAILFPQNLPPSVDAGPDLSLSRPGYATLLGKTTDDGNPNPPGKLSVTWTQTSGPGDVVFTSPHESKTVALFSETGRYVLRLAASDGEFTHSDDVIVVVSPPNPPNHPPAVEAGPDCAIEVHKLLDLIGRVSDDGRPSPPRLTVRWSKLHGPGKVIFQNSEAATTRVKFFEVGHYVLRLSASDGEKAASDDLLVTVTRPSSRQVTH